VIVLEINSGVHSGNPEVPEVQTDDWIEVKPRKKKKRENPKSFDEN